MKTKSWGADTETLEVFFFCVEIIQIDWNSFKQWFSIQWCEKVICIDLHCLQKLSVHPIPHQLPTSPPTPSRVKGPIFLISFSLSSKLRTATILDKQSESVNIMYNLSTILSTFQKQNWTIITKKKGDHTKYDYFL